MSAFKLPTTKYYTKQTASTGKTLQFILNPQLSLDLQYQNRN